jgi:hypothetical protein
MLRAREFVEIREHAPSGWQQRGSGLICGESSTVPNVARPRTRQYPRQLGGLECLQRSALITCSPRLCSRVDFVWRVLGITVIYIFLLIHHLELSIDWTFITMPQVFSRNGVPEAIPVLKSLPRNETYAGISRPFSAVRASLVPLVFIYFCALFLLYRRAQLHLRPVNKIQSSGGRSKRYDPGTRLRLPQPVLLPI